VLALSTRPQSSEMPLAVGLGQGVTPIGILHGPRTLVKAGAVPRSRLDHLHGMKDQVGHAPIRRAVGVMLDSRLWIDDRGLTRDLIA